MPAPKPKKHTLSYRLMVRLSPAQLLALKLEAKKQSLAESALVRKWTVERLEAVVEK